LGRGGQQCRDKAVNIRDEEKGRKGAVEAVKGMKHSYCDRDACKGRPDVLLVVKIQGTANSLMHAYIHHHSLL